MIDIPPPIPKPLDFKIEESKEGTDSQMIEQAEGMSLAEFGKMRSSEEVDQQFNRLELLIKENKILEEQLLDDQI